MGNQCQISQVTQGANCPIRSFLPVAWFLSEWDFPFPLFRSGLGLECSLSSVLSILLSATGPHSRPLVVALTYPALVLYALGTEHLPRCSHRGCAGYIVGGCCDCEEKKKANPTDGDRWARSPQKSGAFSRARESYSTGIGVAAAP